MLIYVRQRETSAPCLGSYTQPIPHARNDARQRDKDGQQASPRHHGGAQKDDHSGERKGQSPADGGFARLQCGVHDRLVTHTVIVARVIVGRMIVAGVIVAGVIVASFTIPAVVMACVPLRGPTVTAVVMACVFLRGPPMTAVVMACVPLRGPTMTAVVMACADHTSDHVHVAFVIAWAIHTVVVHGADRAR